MYVPTEDGSQWWAGITVRNAPLHDDDVHGTGLHGQEIVRPVTR